MNMRFDVVSEMTAHSTPDGRIVLRPARRSQRPQKWTGISRTVRNRVTFEGGSAVLEVFRGEVFVRGFLDPGGYSSKEFSGFGRYLAAQSYLRSLRREAAQWVESGRQLARIAR